MTTRSGEQGYVLISVLTLSAIIALLAAAVLVNVRALAVDAADFRERVAARTLADAAINRAILAYAASLSSTEPDPLRDLLTPTARIIVWEFAGAEIHVSVQAESGKLDLNAAPLQLIEALLRSEVPAPLRRERFLSRIRDARRNRAILVSVAAILDPIERMTETRARFEALFTVHTYQSGIDGESAPEPVLRAVPDLSAEQRRMLLEGVEVSEFESDVSPHLIQPKPIYTIQASVRTPGGIAFGRKALVELRTDKPPRIYFWRDAFPRFGEGAPRFSDTSLPTRG